MINVVINYDREKKEYKLYEPTTDTIIITSNLTETFVKLSEFLVKAGMISEADILGSNQVSYHLDSGTMIAMIESNVNLMKRLVQSAPSVFTSAAQKFGGGSGNPLPSQKTQAAQSGGDRKPQSGGKNTGFLRNTGDFSKTSFRLSGRKFGSR